MNAFTADLLSQGMATVRSTLMDSLAEKSASGSNLNVYPGWRKYLASDQTRQQTSMKVTMDTEDEKQFACIINAQRIRLAKVNRLPIECHNTHLRLQRQYAPHRSLGPWGRRQGPGPPSPRSFCLSYASTPSLFELFTCQGYRCLRTVRT